MSQEKEWEGVKKKVGDVDFLMLNAGVMARGTWGDAEYFQKVCLSLHPILANQDYVIGSAYINRRLENECGG